jgi:(R,R)-butanediol dehydrogenase/meso-butanediol dehydrogenase/diacetyl reductase
MKALVLHAAGDARIEERPEPPPPGPGEVLLRITRAGLCGTDVAEYKVGPVMTPLAERHPSTGVLGPIILGHEFIGRVEAAGAGVARDVGQRLAAGAGQWCGGCGWCRRGQTNLCERYWTLGLSADGGLTELVVVPDQMLHPVAPQVTDDNAALAQPLAVAIHAVRRSGMAPGDRVVVNGAGAIGSFIVAAAAAAGAGQILAVDIDESRLDGALQLGASAVLNASGGLLPEQVASSLGGVLPDVTIEASGAPQAVALMQAVTRRGGSLLLVGLHKKPVPMDLLDLTLREVDVRTTVAHCCDADLPCGARPARRAGPGATAGGPRGPAGARGGGRPRAAGGRRRRGKILVDTQA